MRLLICNAPSNKATMRINTQDDYLKACALIDGCVARNLSVAVETNNQVIANWLVDQYSSRCLVQFDK